MSAAKKISYNIHTALILASPVRPLIGSFAQKTIQDAGSFFVAAFQYSILVDGDQQVDQVLDVTCLVSRSSPPKAIESSIVLYLSMLGAIDLSKGRLKALYSFQSCVVVVKDIRECPHFNVMSFRVFNNETWKRQ